MFRFCLLLLTLSSLRANELMDCFLDTLISAFEHVQDKGGSAYTCLERLQELFPTISYANAQYCRCNGGQYEDGWFLGRYNTEVASYFNTMFRDWKTLNLTIETKGDIDRFEDKLGVYSSRHNLHLTSWDRSRKPIRCYVHYMTDKDRNGEEKFTKFQLFCDGCKFRAQSRTCDA